MKTTKKTSLVVHFSKATVVVAISKTKLSLFKAGAANDIGFVPIAVLNKHKTVQDYL